MDLVFFDIFTLFLVILDMRNYEKQITPLAIIALVYLSLININNLVIYTIYDFYKVDSSTIWKLFVFFVAIFMVDILFGCLYRRTHRVNLNCSVRFRNYRGITFLFAVGVVAYGLQFLRLYSHYGLNIKGKNNGILGHLSSFAFILGPLSLDLAIKSKKKVNIGFSSIMNVTVVLISVLFGGKYVIFINLMYFLLCFVLKRDNKINIRKLIKIILPLVMVAIGVFAIIYYVVPRVTGTYVATMDFVIQHMFEYLLGPIIANNYTMSHPESGNSLIPFTVLINIGKALMGSGNYVSSIYSFLFPFKSGTTTNVSGILGESVYDLGFLGAIIYIVAIFLIVNIFFYMYRSKNKFYLCFCYCSAILVFTFFCNFFSVSGVVLPLLLAFAMDILSMCKVDSHHI